MARRRPHSLFDTGEYDRWSQEMLRWNERTRRQVAEYAASVTNYPERFRASVERGELAPAMPELPSVPPLPEIPPDLLDVSSLDTSFYAKAVGNVAFVDRNVTKKVFGIERVSNERRLTGWRHRLHLWFSGYRWARRLIGGLWEEYWVELCKAFIWEPVTRWSYDQWSTPTPASVYPPRAREDWSGATRTKRADGPYREAATPHE